MRTSSFVLAKVLGVNTNSVLILQEEKCVSQKSEKKYLGFYSMLKPSSKSKFCLIVSKINLEKKSTWQGQKQQKQEQ